MVRTLDGPLTSALAALTKVPSISCVIQDFIPHLTSYQSPAGADAWHDACIAADGSIVRVQVIRGGTGFDRSIQVQRVTDPSIGSQWTTWTTLSGGSGNMFDDGGCAISNNSGTIRAFGQRGTGGNNLWVWTSTDNGATWSGPVSVLSPPGGALIKGIASSGQNDVFFLYDVVGGEDIGCSFISGGVWSGLNTWSLSPIAASGGLAVAYVSSSSLYWIVYSDSYTLSSVSRTLGGTWTAGPVVTPATSTAIGRLSPRIQFFDGLYQLICTESDSGVLTGVTYSYPRVRQTADFAHWSNGFILHPLTNTYGACLIKLPAPQTGSSGARYYCITMAAVYSAVVSSSSNANQYLDVSARVLSYKREERGEKPARLDVILDNNRGALNGLVYTSGTTWEPISENATVTLSEGYLTGGPPPTTPDQVVVGMYRINQILFVRTPQENEIHLVCYDHSRDLDLQCRWQITYTNQTIAWLVTEICARAGLFSPVVPSTTNTGQLIGQYILHAGVTYRQALNELCQAYGLWYFMDQAEIMQFKELTASDPIVWTYSPEWETVSFSAQDERANHIIVSGKPPAGGLSFALTEGEAYDDSNAQLVQVERLIHHTDMKLTATSQCIAKAASLLAQEQRAQVAHTVTVPCNPALQLYDGISLSDSVAPTGSGQSSNCRVIQSIVQFDAAKALYEHHLALEGL